MADWPVNSGLVDARIVCGLCETDRHGADSDSRSAIELLSPVRRESGVLSPIPDAAVPVSSRSLAVMGLSVSPRTSNGRTIAAHSQMIKYVAGGTVDLGPVQSVTSIRIGGTAERDVLLGGPFDDVSVWASLSI